MAKKLNPRQSAYCRARAKGLTQEESLKLSGYTCVGGSARALGSKMDKSVNICQQIQQEKVNLFNVHSVNPEWVIKSLCEIARNGELESNKVRALELIGKTFAMFITKEQTEDITDKATTGDLRRSIGSAMDYMEKGQEN